VRPNLELTDLPDNRLKRWHLIQKIFQEFWKRWHVEYLHQLQQRGKWFKTKSDLKPGVLVVLKEENTPPLK
jgi:hypothetical protein